MEHRIRYHNDIPEFLQNAIHVPEMQRLKDIGMDCGCEYTSFPRFKDLDPYSRFDHSMGVALIVWHFTGDVQQTLSALFHDISSPVFAHVVDFINGDHMKQEFTEEGTYEIIRSSSEIQTILSSLSLTAEDVCDYHRFPVADNDAPYLSADRLEYSCCNMIRYGFVSSNEVQQYYDDLFVGINEDGSPELMFSSEENSLGFAQAALQCSQVYVSDEDRFSMQSLADILGNAIHEGILTKNDLYTTEPMVIQKLKETRKYRAEWERYRSYCRMLRSDVPVLGKPWIKVPSKKRFIDPYLSGKGRVSLLSSEFRQLRDSFLSQSLEYWICGQSEQAL